MTWLALPDFGCNLRPNPHPVASIPPPTITADELLSNPPSSIPFDPLPPLNLDMSLEGAVPIKVHSNSALPKSTANVRRNPIIFTRFRQLCWH